MTDLDRERELGPAEKRRGVIVTLISSVIAALAFVGLLYIFVPWNNSTASDSAKNNTDATIGQSSAPALGDRMKDGP